MLGTLPSVPCRLQPCRLSICTQLCVPLVCSYPLGTGWSCAQVLPQPSRSWNVQPHTCARPPLPSQVQLKGCFPPAAREGLPWSVQPHLCIPLWSLGQVCCVTSPSWGLPGVSPTPGHLPPQQWAPLTGPEPFPGGQQGTCVDERASSAPCPSSPVISIFRRSPCLFIAMT